MTQRIQHLPSKCEDWSSDLQKAGKHQVLCVLLTRPTPQQMETRGPQSRLATGLVLSWGLELRSPKSREMPGAMGAPHMSSTLTVETRGPQGRLAAGLALPAHSWFNWETLPQCDVMWSVKIPYIVITSQTLEHKYTIHTFLKLRNIFI